jgi:2-polyprenyl-6-methoxyphenol hydroxylase-like FAD-dependent oxidoreductase
VQRLRAGRVGRIDHRLVSDLTPHGYTLHFGQHELARMVLRLFLALPGAQMRWDTAFEELRQEGDVVAVRLSNAKGSQTLEFDWIIGADGARGSVRRAMDATFDGFTWPETFMATNVYYDFESCGYAYSNSRAMPHTPPTVPRSSSSAVPRKPIRRAAWKTRPISAPCRTTPRWCARR